MAMETGLAGNFNRYFKEDPPQDKLPLAIAICSKDGSSTPYFWGRPGS